MVIAAGGTGGHLFPGIAVAEVLKKLDPQGEITFVSGEGGLEQEILKKEGFNRETIIVGRIKGEGWRDRVRTLVHLPRAFLRARELLRSIRPDLVLGVGGYSSGPVLLAAFVMRIRRAILEPNSIPGFTNRILGRMVQKIFISFPETARFFPSGKVLMTGTPVRRKITEAGAGFPSAPAREKPFTILVLGGSQGATALNRAVVDLLPSLEKSGRPVRIVHQTGIKDHIWVREAYQRSLVSHHVIPFIDDMAAVLRDADLAVSRAGASAVAELIESRTPSILVPYPYAADDHQRFNALSLVRVGGAEMILNRELATRLGTRILYYEGHREELKKMKGHLSGIRKTPAAEQIARECLTMAKGSE